MAGLKEIRRRITSVKNTKQITRAMKLVSAAKLRRAQDAAVNGRGFVEHLARVMAHVLNDLPEDFSHPLTEERKERKNRCIVVLAGERGLCGAYNTNVMKAVTAQLKDSSPHSVVVAMGRRAVSNAKRLKWEVVREFEGLSEEASKWPAHALGEELIRGYTEGRFDEVTLVYTKFISAMTQRVAEETLLPLSSESLLSGAGSGAQNERKVSSGQINYSPSVEETFSKLLPILIKARLLQAGLESKASEHAARMTAMDSATNNADDLIERLRLFYNRARQSAITRELIDIVGGAEAVK